MDSPQHAALRPVFLEIQRILSSTGSPRITRKQVQRQRFPDPAPAVCWDWSTNSQEKRSSDRWSPGLRVNVQVTIVARGRFVTPTAGSISEGKRERINRPLKVLEEFADQAVAFFLRFRRKQLCCRFHLLRWHLN